MSNEIIRTDNLKKEFPSKTVLLGWTLLIVGVVGCAFAYAVDPRRSGFNNIIFFLFLTSIGAGSIFLIALEYITGAVWSVPMRRVNEFLGNIVPILPLLALPVLFNIQEIFHWSRADNVAADAVLQAKQPYLNINFFVIRFLIISSVWILFYFLFTRNSKKQDITKDQKLTKLNIRFAGAFLPLFAIAISVTAIDWAMSIEPHWYSTIFGVYYFSGTALAAISAATFVILKFMDNGYLPQLHRDSLYSLGALMFAFVNFWAYIAFSQFLLIWYANLPEETYWFMMRWRNGWQYISVLLIIVHFAVPYFALLAQDAKMDVKRLKFISIWILFAHFLDLYWLVMPSYNGSIVLSWFEIGFPFVAIGLVIVLLAYKVKRNNLVPIGDPKLERGLNFRL